MSDNMDERKKTILRAITDDYISTAEPVGSRTIAKKYSLGVSPATIRNEMADLEDDCLLYTSQGQSSDKQVLHWWHIGFGFGRHHAGITP